MFDEPPAFAEYVHATLVSVVDVVAPYRRIAVGRDPDAGKIITMDPIVDELTETVFVDVNAARLAVMNFALYDRRVRASFHFETGDPIVVDIVCFEKTLYRMNKKTILNNTLENFQKGKITTIILFYFLSIEPCGELVAEFLFPP